MTTRRGLFAKLISATASLLVFPLCRRGGFVGPWHRANYIINANTLTIGAPVAGRFGRITTAVKWSVI